MSETLSHSSPATPAAAPAPARSDADRAMRRVLRLDPDGPRTSIFGAESVASRSIAIAAARCLFTYIFVPVAGPVLGISTSMPVVGIVLSLVTVVAIVAAIRRFFAADHKWRWKYLALASVLLVLAVVQGTIDVVHLVS